MSLWLPTLEGQIYARVVADTTLIGAEPSYARAIRNVYAAADQAFPFLTFDIDNSRVDDGFSVRHHVVDFRVHAWVDAENLSSTYNAFARGDAIMERIAGDWEVQATRTPSYGLDRWQPSLTGWSAALCELTGIRTSHDPGVLHWIADFRVRVSK